MQGRSADKKGVGTPKLAILKQLQTQFKSKRENGVGTLFPRVPAPLHPAAMTKQWTTKCPCNTNAVSRFV